MENNFLYEKLNAELDSLIDSTSEFRHFGKKKWRILVDKDEPKIPAIVIRLKNRYLELQVRFREKGIDKCKSLGKYLLKIQGTDSEADHRNHNVLDNRRINLREVSRNVNLLNRRRYNFSNQYKGVRILKSAILVEVCSNKNVYTLRLPVTHDINEAAVIYDCIALVLNGENHTLNMNRNDYSGDLIKITYDFYKDKIKSRNG